MALVEVFGKIIDRDQTLIDISRDECEENLSEFIRQAWHVVEPGAEYIHNWHVDMIAEHLRQSQMASILKTEQNTTVY